MNHKNDALKWQTENLACNCCYCKKVILCGTRKKRKPADRIGGRPYCKTCYEMFNEKEAVRELKRKKFIPLRDGDRERVIRKSIPLEE